jgi:hypothetical protein
MAVRVRDLEIALVLAREMKAAAERSVDASLRLDQLQEVFGVQELDRAERARIQTALQMAGLEPFPSLLEAEPSEPIRFGASKTAVAASGGAPASPPPPPAPPPADEAPVEAEAQPAFPTVGEFARSKLRSRRFGVRRGDHGDDEAPPPPEPAAPHEAPAEANGHLPEEPVMEEGIVDDHPIAEEEDELYDEPEPLQEAEPELEPEPEPEQREYIPLAPDQPVAYEEPEPEPEPQPGGASPAQVAAVLLPAVAIPVIATSIAGWRFGLPFVALSVIATGWVLSRERSGFFASIRGSRAARTALTVTALVTVLSIGAAAVLAALRDSSSTTKSPATPAQRAPKPQVTSVPVTPPAASQHKKKHKAKASKPATAPKQAATAPKQTTTPAPSTPPPDPATQGLIRVPPSSGGSGTTTTP